MAQKPLITENEGDATDKNKKGGFGGLMNNVASWTSKTAKEASTALSSATNTIGHSVVKPTVSENEAKERLQQRAEQKEKEQEDMKWFDDIVDGTESKRGNTQILSSIWKEVTGESMLTRIMSSKQRKSAKIWGKLCHRCEISYPLQDKLTIVDMFNGDNVLLMNEIKYAVRHAIAAYPPSFVVFLGLKTDVSFALKSNKKLLKSCFNIDPKDVIYDNCTNNLIIQNKTHQPSFYLCVDHEMKKIILSIRGSSSIADALTDVNAIAKSFSFQGIDGYVHEGILASAKFVFDKVTNDLINTCKQYPMYQTVITGHSLGAGVAALLGLLYYNHPIIFTQNKLKVFPFASPCVLSKDFTNKKLGDRYIYSIALSTDLVTRLSLESVKQQNIRLDVIEKYDQETIKQCMVHLKDDRDANKCKDAELLEMLQKCPTPNPDEQLFPIGQIYWLVPKACMDDSILHRRKQLMCLKDENDKKETTNFKMESPKNNNLSTIIGATINNVTKGIEEFQQTMDQSILNTGGSKFAKLYDGSNYIFCKATKCRYMFQELVLDLPESLYAHMPNRYMWACDAHLTRGNLNDDE